MKRSLLYAMALLLPLIVLGLTATVQQHSIRSASSWTIPISGYDPRDPLRGHYLNFSYDWQIAGTASLCSSTEGCTLCLEEGTKIVATVRPAGATCRHPVDLKRSNIGFRPGLRGTAVFTGRIFVSEARAPILTRTLERSPAFLLARLTTDGRLVAQSVVTDDGAK